MIIDSQGQILADHHIAAGATKLQGDPARGSQYPAMGVRGNFLHREIGTTASSSSDLRRKELSGGGPTATVG